VHLLIRALKLILVFKVFLKGKILNFISKLERKPHDGISGGLI
jgi:hypothetical protein